VCVVSVCPSTRLSACEVSKSEQEGPASPQDRVLPASPWRWRRRWGTSARQRPSAHSQGPPALHGRRQRRSAHSQGPPGGAWKEYCV